MVSKAQHAKMYRTLPKFLLQLRQEAKLTQRALGARLTKPQSWIYNCETGNRRVDVTEFVAWTRACDADPVTAFTRLINQMK